MQPHHLIRDRLRQEMDRRKLSAVDIARGAGVRNSFIYDVLNGKSLHPSVIRLKQVADWLGVELSWLAGDDMPADGEERQRYDDFASITRLCVCASPGGGIALVEERMGGPCPFHREWIRGILGATPEQLRLLTLAGKNLEGGLQEGDVVLVDLRPDARTKPGLFAFFDGRALSVRQLAKPTGGGAKNQLIGRVVWMARSL